MSLPEPRQAFELAGHDAAAARLARIAASGRIPHGWLFSGPRGIGKATLAWRFARALLGAAHDAQLRSEPTDRVFRMLASGGHPDLHVLEVEPSRGKRAVIKVDQARDLKEAFGTTAGLGGRRVLIVDAADDLNPQSANAILKLLEEPPPGAVLLLINHVPGRILPTIASRCIRLRLKPLDELTLARLLAEALPERSAADRSALIPFAQGSIGRALWLDAVGFLRLYQDVLQGCIEALQGGSVMELAAKIAAALQATGAQAPFEVPRAILHRALQNAAGRVPPGSDEAERAALSTLAARRPLDAWGAPWDNLARLAARFEPQSLSADAASLAAATMLMGDPGDRIVLPEPW
ncbi:DNA polymerase III subunit delta' [Geminicoccus roseus]|uniref:DNA polymerase III subunit delta' n=1 Tax=Geminicoccus roseus TaxID=404900 RepID=UPI000416BFBE|nr:DNA polymerase III subunit delta' [Geminicoccus roseus]